MNAFVVILPPRDITPAEFEAAVRKHVNSPDFINIPPAVPSKSVEDTDQLPLWRWFISS